MIHRFCVCNGGERGKVSGGRYSFFNRTGFCSFDMKVIMSSYEYYWFKLLNKWM